MVMLAALLKAWGSLAAAQREATLADRVCDVVVVVVVASPPV